MAFGLPTVPSLAARAVSAAPGLLARATAPGIGAVAGAAAGTDRKCVGWGKSVKRRGYISVGAGSV
ncbi:hypothetical protein ABZ646_45370, partial [Streptomyces sp. NPDC007162]|uniref:hypothetical protein n=1 Tax=Streptomyces sp. NPDC007162 TaxID=3156917 RepID=UPI0033E8A945